MRKKEEPTHKTAKKNPVLLVIVTKSYEKKKDRSISQFPVLLFLILSKGWAQASLEERPPLPHKEGRTLPPWIREAFLWSLLLL